MECIKKWNKNHKSASNNCSSLEYIFYIHFSHLFISFHIILYLLLWDWKILQLSVCVFFISFIIENYIRLMSSWFLFNLYKYFIPIVIHNDDDDVWKDFSLFYFKNSSFSVVDTHFYVHFSYRQILLANKKLLLYLLELAAAKTFSPTLNKLLLRQSCRCQCGG